MGGIKHYVPNEGTRPRCLRESPHPPGWGWGQGGWPRAGGGRDTPRAGRDATRTSAGGKGRLADVQSVSERGGVRNWHVVNRPTHLRPGGSVERLGVVECVDMLLLL